MADEASTSVDLPGLSVESDQTAYSIAKFDISITFSPVGDSIHGTVNFATDLFDKTTVERFIHYFHRTVEGMAGIGDLANIEDRAEPLSEANAQLHQQLSILSENERDYLLNALNHSRSPYPMHTCLHQLTEQHAAQSPNAIAVFQGALGDIPEQVLTYRELNEQANQLAHRLIQQGVKPGALVGLCVTRRPYMMTAILAILKAGGAYVPLDPLYASSRLQGVVQDVALQVLLADAQGVAVLGETVALQPVIRIDSNWQASSPAPLPVSNPDVPGLTSRDLAYVIHTSGSTGKPKGVMVEHQSVMNLAYGFKDIFALNSNMNWCLNASISFDASLKGVINLLFGAQLTLLHDITRKDAGQMADYLVQHRVSGLDCTASQLNLLLPELATRYAERNMEGPVITMAVGGEAIDEELWQALALNPHVNAFNVYGPTEATVNVTCQAMVPNMRPNLGGPMANVALYILDDYLQPVVQGATGELYLAGDGIARGYLNQSELTQERFVPNPFHPLTEDGSAARMYKSGDLARHLPSGAVEFLGRNDFQVKIRGFRIELGEIEARLNEAAPVQNSAVLAIDKAQTKQLVAYVVPQDKAVLEDKSLEAQLISELRNKLSGDLPDYMVPAALMFLDKMPLTPSGKLDTKALPAIDDSFSVKAHYEAPQGEVEHALAEMWSAVLDVENIGRHDDFFALGGNSLTVLKLVGQAKNAAIPLSTRTVFESPRLYQMAQDVLLNEEQNHTIINVKRSASDKNLFVLPTGRGSVAYAKSVADKLAHGCNVYALQWTENATDALPQTFDELVQSKVNDILKIQTDGAFCLLSYSSGGVLAYAIAHRLRCMGKLIGFVGLFDTTVPIGGAKTLPPEQECDQIRQGLALETEIVNQHGIHTLDSSTWQQEMQKLEPLRSPMELNNAILDLFTKYDLDPRWEMSYRHYHQAKTYGALLSHYQAQMLDIPVVNFQATELSDGSLIAANQMQTFTQGMPWCFIDERDITTVPVPGNHMSMVLDEAHFAALMRQVNRQLADALADELADELPSELASKLGTSDLVTSDRLPKPKQESKFV